MHNFSLQSGKWANIVPQCLRFDTYCTLCARPGQPEIDLCSACQAQLKTRLHTDGCGIRTILCAGCGEEFTLGEAGYQKTGHSDGHCISPDSYLFQATVCQQSEAALSDIADFCNDCVSGPGRLFGRILVPYRYTFPIDKLIKRLKYRNDRQLARVLGTLLAISARSTRELALPDLLLPMPLHGLRQRERGFNQAQDIARWCGHYLGIEMSATLASRWVDTGSLAGLSRAERQHRILGAFRASDTLLNKHVAIVDDVLTTGASARELAREIYDSGAASVELWVLARTSRLRAGA